MCPHDRLMDLCHLMAARRAASQRISLAVLFAKAYGRMAAEFPEFRQMYLRWPLASVYQHDRTIVMMAITREFRGEQWLFWGRFASPETRSLSDLQNRLHRYQTEPVEEAFEKQIGLSMMPLLARRAIWWWNLNSRGLNRARRTGTAFLSTLAGRGAEITNPPSFQTGCISYGPLDDAGCSRVTLSYDHRLMDGAVVAAALERLEEILSDEMARELRGLDVSGASSDAARHVA